MGREETKSRKKERGTVEKQKTGVKNGQRELEDKFEHLYIAINSSDESDSEVSDAQCPVCGISYQGDDSESVWVCCDNCELWLDFKCTGLKKKPKGYQNFIIVQVANNFKNLHLCMCFIWFLLVSHNTIHVL